MTNWSLEHELLQLSNQHSLLEAIEALQLLPVPMSFRELVEGDGWYRGGAETYLYRFSLVTNDGDSHEYILKACVSFVQAQSVKQVMDKWLSRRRLLATHEIATPRLHASNHGVLLEEYIPFALADINMTMDILLRLASLAGTLMLLGFRPIDGFFGDLRSHGNDVVVVDFGQDLGEPDLNSHHDSTILDILVRQLSTWESSITPPVFRSIEEKYWSTVGINQ